MTSTATGAQLRQHTAADPPPRHRASAAGAADARLRRGPVRGSVATRLMPSQPQPRAAWACLLPVSVVSPSRAQTETKLFLSGCPTISDDLGDAAILAVSELVSNAYTAMETGPVSDVAGIDLSLRLFDDHLLIEVTDSSPRPPVADLAESATADGGRGLAVVDIVSEHQWGYFWQTGRKVVFCQLRLAPGLKNLPTGSRAADNRSPVSARIVPESKGRAGFPIRSSIREAHEETSSCFPQLSPGLPA